MRIQAVTILSASQVNDWMEDLLFSCSEDLFRFKGVLAIDGWPDRFIFQVCTQQVHISLSRLSCSLLLSSRLVSSSFALTLQHQYFLLLLPCFFWGQKGHTTSVAIHPHERKG